MIVILTKQKWENLASWGYSQDLVLQISDLLAIEISKGIYEVCKDRYNTETPFKLTGKDLSRYLIDSGHLTR